MSWYHEPSPSNADDFGERVSQLKESLPSRDFDAQDPISLLLKEYKPQSEPEADYKRALESQAEMRLQLKQLDGATGRSDHLEWTEELDMIVLEVRLRLLCLQGYQSDRFFRFLGDLYNDLADSLEIRYNLRSNTRDLEEAVKYASLAVSYTPNDHPNLAIRYRSVGVKYTRLYDGDRSLALFDKAKEALGHAIDLVAQQNPHEDDKAADLQKRLTNLYELQRGDPSYPDKARKEARRWFKSEMDEVNIFMGNYRRPPVSESDIVKIAVLDTGIDLDHPKLSRYKTGDKISQEYYKDFVSNDQMARDSSGHGTHCVHTILKVCRTAKIYVARIFDSDAGDQGTAQRVVDAIEWAVECKVDIISMAFSFPQHHVNVMNAISSARDQHGVLFFAAATNDAHFKEDSVGFTATMADVIRVNSCSYNGQQSRFSPDSDRNTANALSTLGEEIEAAFPVTLNDGKPLKCLTGTSMATSIMSGIAGLLIEFTKLCGDSSLPKDNVSNMRDQLRTPEGMRSVLYHCMAGVRQPEAPKYSYILPWVLFRGHKELGGIADDIVRALKPGI